MQMHYQVKISLYITNEFFKDVFFTQLAVINIFQPNNNQSYKNVFNKGIFITFGI